MLPDQANHLGQNGWRNVKKAVGGTENSELQKASVHFQ